MTIFTSAIEEELIAALQAGELTTLDFSPLYP